MQKSFGAVRALRSARSSVEPGSIHALVGENGAGKSTLVKIVAGVHRRDAGTLRFQGEDVDFGSTAESKAAGIAVIYQEPTLFPDLSVTENIFMGRQPLRGRAPDRPARDVRRGRRPSSSGSASTSTRAGRPAVSPSPTSRSSRSPRPSRSTPSLLIMDEPTAALSGVEVERLFAVARSLRDEGRGPGVHLAPLRRGVRPLRHGHGDARRGVRLDPADRGDHRRPAGLAAWSVARWPTCSRRRRPRSATWSSRWTGLESAGTFHGVSFTVRAG